MPTAKKKWAGQPPTVCELCGGPFEGVFIDGRTQGGPWGLLCAGCHALHGVGLGLGKGQKYDLVTLEKVEG